MKNNFTHGDRIRRKSGGPVVTVQNIDDTAYHFAEGGFCLIADQDCYRLVERASGYFRVAADLRSAPLDDYVCHGYEERCDFIAALHRLTDRWGNRIGQRLQERNGFLKLHFADMPGKVTEDVWLPLYLLTPCPMPDYLIPPPSPDPIEQELDEAFGFD